MHSANDKAGPSDRDRLAEHGITQKFFDQIVKQAIEAGLTSDEHFTVDGSLIQSHASLKSLKKLEREASTPRISSPTSALLTEGWAANSNPSSVLGLGNRASLTRRCVDFCSRSSSSASARRSRNAGWSAFSLAHNAAVFSYSRSMVGSLSALRWYCSSVWGLLGVGLLTRHPRSSR
jgi:hypothetical protein